MAAMVAILDFLTEWALAIFVLYSSISINEPVASPPPSPTATTTIIIHGVAYLDPRSMVGRIYVEYHNNWYRLNI